MLHPKPWNPEVAGSRAGPPGPDSGGDPDWSQSHTGLAQPRRTGRQRAGSPASVLCLGLRVWEGGGISPQLSWNLGKSRAHPRPQCHSLENGQDVSMSWDPRTLHIPPGPRENVSEGRPGRGPHAGLCVGTMGVPGAHLLRSVGN